MRTPKEIFALGIALAIGLIALYDGTLKKFRNIWLLLFVGFYFVSILCAPDFKDFIMAYLHNGKFTFISARPLTGVWSFKPFLYAFIYLIMAVSVSSLWFPEYSRHRIIQIMAVCGLLMSIYIFQQAIGLDQFFKIMPQTKNPDVPYMTNPTLAGFMGQPTVVSPFILMTIPMSLYLRKYLWAVCMVMAVVLTQSKVALSAMIIGLIVYFILSRKKAYKCVGVLLISCLLVSGAYVNSKYPLKKWLFYAESESNGRFDAWKVIWKDFTSDINGKKTCLTGLGPGAFYYVFPMRNNSRFWQVHNDPFELLYNFGFGGLFLFFMAVRHMVKQTWRVYRKGNEYAFTILMSLFFVFLCSFGTFPFQIAPIMFYSVVIVGLLHNESILEG